VSTIKLLLVDDLEGNLLALKALLLDTFPASGEKQDIDILMAKSGTEALSLLLDEDFALALIDVQMPRMDGFELAELMRGTDKTKRVPIIFVTAGARDANHTFKGYESGAVDFIYKPFDPEIVKSKVKIFVELARQRLLLKEQLLQTQEKERELEKALSVRDEFLGIASHELRTPLTSLKLHLQMMDRNVRKEGLHSISPERFDKMLRTSNRQVENLTRLIEDLMDVSRIANGKLQLESETTDLVAIVKEVADYFGEHLSAAGCDFKLDAPEPVIGTWDRHRIQQVIVNLISNAIKYGPGSPILVSVKTENDHAIFSVSDHGIGIAEKDQKRIFDRFERAVHGKSSVSGLGLGLFIVKEILNAQGGTIDVDSESGKGATFKVTLPLNQIQQAQVK
jgi:signal transduction histidine kinase